MRESTELNFNQLPVILETRQVKNKWQWATVQGAVGSNSHLELGLRCSPAGFAQGGDTPRAGFTMVQLVLPLRASRARSQAVSNKR